MPRRAIYITESDMRRLRELLRTTKDPYGKQRPHLQVLQKELDRARLIADQDVDPDVVTMNSDVRLRDCQTDAEIGCTIVFPDFADAAEGRISVLAPLGAALLGYRTGDRVSFTAPAGKQTCEILELTYQPEAAGDLHL
ncbi:MAG: nucleoside diphosphate kinase regulator [Pirellulaceae bacterium]